MHEIFVMMLNLSLTSCLIVVAIALIRLVFRKAPKKILCALWILVAIRLLCPVFIPSPISVYNIFEFESNPRSYFEYNGDAEMTEVEFNTETSLESDEAVNESSFIVQTFDFYFPTLMRIWFIGTIVMIATAVISYVRLRYTVRASIKIEDGIFICDEISTPFILGIIRPVIYLPTGIASETKSHVIAHERAHIKRGDFIWKPLSYLILCLYWFNPFIWLAFILFCRDMEMACDEKVINNMDKDFISRYSEALLNFASGKRLISVCPLAFGEVGVKQRIKSILKYKRPGKIVIGIAIAIGIALAAVFLTGPKEAEAVIGDGDASTSIYIYNDTNMEAISDEGVPGTDTNVDTDYLPNEVVEYDLDSAVETTVDYNYFEYEEGTIETKYYDAKDPDAIVKETGNLLSEVMGFYKGYIHNDENMMRTAMSKFLSILPHPFPGWENSDNIAFVGISGVEAVVEGHSNQVRIQFRDDKNEKVYILSIIVTRDPDGWRIMTYQLK